MGKLLGGLFGGGGGQQKQTAAPTAAAAKKLFSPEQVQKMTGDYSKQGEAKWGQILSNMGAGGGTGGDLNTGIASQATSMGQKLGELTDQSGYGGEGFDTARIMKDVEGGIGAKYGVY